MYHTIRNAEKTYVNQQTNEQNKNQKKKKHNKTPANLEE